ncbi:MAG: hypothetical protein DWI72_00865 [Candidatus Aquidulcis sp.]|nr:MAG: hypothetical protein DWI66_00695 [Candidatus Aquidulcis sp.]RLT58861.1 MAG: hypothetical protein DWI72_00865 [Candidatus Aquidulcis sp.]
MNVLRAAQRSTKSGCGTLIVGLIILGAIGSLFDGGTDTSTPRPSATASASNDPETSPSVDPSPSVVPSLPIALEVDPPVAVARGAEVLLTVRASAGSECEIGVPALAREGEAPAALFVPSGGLATFTWRAGSTKGVWFVTVVCTAEFEREALEVAVTIK